MVTVLLAVYNGEVYIKEQLDSLLTQTFKEFQIVYSDDGSTDRTPLILKEYEKKFPGKIKELLSSRSGSAQGNFFHLLTHAAGEYLMLCDQDDIWLPDKIEATLKEMKRMEDQYGVAMPILVHGDLAVAGKNGRILHKSLAQYQKIAVEDNRFSHYLVENNITGNTIMINQALKQYLSYIPEECMMHDWWLGLLASCFGKISYLQRPLVLYRQHGENQLGAKSGSQQLLNRAGDQVRKNYDRMFRQAELFFTQYKNSMPKEQAETIEQFLRLPSMSRRGKISAIIKYQFVKSTRLRTLLQMFSI